MKKLVYLFAVLMILSGFLGVFAEEQTPLETSDGFVYIFKGEEDGTVEIVGYVGPGGKISIPEFIDGLPVTSIGQSAFGFNMTLSEVNIPGTVETINENAFENCYSLKTIHIAEGVRWIKDSFAWECEALTTVNLPDSLESLGDASFSGCETLETIKISPNHAYLKLTDGVLYSKPDKRLIWYPIPKSNSHFSIPEGTEIIGWDAFDNSSLETVSIPESVHTIGWYAFSSSSMLTEINIPSKVTELHGVFNSCYSLEKVTVAKDNPVFEAPDGVLINKQTKTLVLFPYGRPDTSYTVPSTVEIIANGAFSGWNLEKIVVPGTVQKIESLAFLGCWQLKSITLMEGIREIQSGAFEWDSALTSVTFPDSLEKLGSNPFVYTENMREIIVSPNHPYLTVQNGCLISKDDMRLISYLQTNKAEKLEIPQGVKIIDALAFTGNKYLKELVIPEGVLKINQYVFDECENLTRITLPESLQEIDRTAFQYFLTYEKDMTFVVVRGSVAENFVQSFGFHVEYAGE